MCLGSRDAYILVASHHRVITMGNGKRMIVPNATLHNTDRARSSYI